MSKFEDIYFVDDLLVPSSGPVHAITQRRERALNRRKSTTGSLAATLDGTLPNIRETGGRQSGLGASYSSQQWQGSHRASNTSRQQTIRQEATLQPRRMVSEILLCNLSMAV